ncbi:MAG TPA: hypothetical protein VJZ73_13370 [Methylomirabilota bacterium]|nr:hypothetical protein [Methylomirabilota bacterium]
MTTQRKMTRPGMHDNEWAAVTCTPEATTVEFFEFDGEAEEAARANLHPTVSTFMCKVVKQGQHAVKGASNHHAVLVDVDDELRRALAHYHDVKGRPRREVVAGWLKGIIGRHLDLIRADYRQSLDTEATQPGVAPPSPSIARMRKIAQPAVDRAHAAIELASSSVMPDRPPWWKGTSCSSRPSSESPCHPGDKCSNFPACESCGPARL